MKVDYINDPGSSNEDAILVKEIIFGVFDGASLDRTKYGEKTGAAIASATASEVFAKNNKSLKELAIEANRVIQESMQLTSKADLTKKAFRWWTTASVVRVNNNEFEWLQIGDSVILVIDKNGSFRLLTEYYDHDREILTRWKELAQQKKENIRAILHDETVRMLNTTINITQGALNGEEEAILFLKFGSESLRGVTHILLFTDGLLIPREDPTKDYDFATLVRFFLEGGLRRVKDYVRDLQRSDPNCWKYPRYKQHDDITAISISL